MANKAIKYPNGNSYEGMVNDYNAPHGIGTMKYADGSVYVGRWGFGAWYMEGTFIDGHRVYVGTWLGTKKSDNVTLVENGEVMYGKMDDMGFLGPNGERLPEPIVEQNDIPTEDKSEPVAHNATRNDAPPYVRLDGKTILFGTYLQTIKADNVTITGTTNDKGYFLGSDGEWYAKVVSTPTKRDYKFSNGATVKERAIYYFKVEPIKWRILSENNGKAILMCDSIIANHRFDDAISSNYEESEIRKWLNAGFYNTAFNEAQRNLILTTTVDNSVASTGYEENAYACNDTLDKIFLPSYSEVADIKVEERRMQTSDYSRAKGAYMNDSTDCYGNGWWWLRSPNNDYISLVRGVNDDGKLNRCCGTGFTDRGVVPALQIQLN